MNDIILTLITIKNSIISKHKNCLIYPRNPFASFKILKLLYYEGFILSYFYDKIKKIIIIELNYYKNKPVINILKIFQKASYPIYIKYEDLLAIHKFGIDVLILSTSKGLKPHYQCIKERLGGRLICYIR